MGKILILAYIFNLLAISMGIYSNNIPAIILGIIGLCFAIFSTYKKYK